VQIGREEWNACAQSGEERNPFVQWEFLAALEDSQSAVREKVRCSEAQVGGSLRRCVNAWCAGLTAGVQGWLPQHIALRDVRGGLLAVCPLYVKGHSYGEYVFDSSWAQLHAQLGEPYYPKLQSCVPFTPVTGPRVLVRGGEGEEGTAIARGAVLETLQRVTDAMGVRARRVGVGSGMRCV